VRVVRGAGHGQERDAQHCRERRCGMGGRRHTGRRWSAQGGRGTKARLRSVYTRRVLRASCWEAQQGQGARAECVVFTIAGVAHVARVTWSTLGGRPSTCGAACRRCGGLPRCVSLRDMRFTSKSPTISQDWSEGLSTRGVWNDIASPDSSHIIGIPYR
jgi:hypothetical protein